MRISAADLGLGEPVVGGQGKPPPPRLTATSPLLSGDAWARIVEVELGEQPHPMHPVRQRGPRPRIAGHRLLADLHEFGTAPRRLPRAWIVGNGRGVPAGPNRPQPADPTPDPRWAFRADGGAGQAARYAALYTAMFFVILGVNALALAQLPAARWTAPKAWVLSQGFGTACNFVLLRAVVFRKPRH